MANASARTDRSVRVFISSTFRDMVQERDQLATQTWPQLHKLCRERQVEFVEVDLRWGVTEAQSTRKETLKLCLEEIGDCRPYFIGILGDRYGWTPGQDAYTSDLKTEEQWKWLQEHRDKSVTELEILHGVLRKPEMAGRAFFYFRDPAYARRHGADFLSQTPADAARQEKLKANIRDTCKRRNIPLKETYADPHELARLVLADLRAAIETDYPIEEVPDAMTREAMGHEAYAEARQRTYIGRPAYYRQLDEHARGTGEPLVLLGQSGSGKSALLANWLKEWQKAHKGDFVFQHYIGGTPDSSDHLHLMTRLMHQIKQWTQEPDAVPNSKETILRDFPLWLAKANTKAQKDKVRCIVILDALNQLAAQESAHTLAWLPERSFTGAMRLITSTLPGPTQQVAEKRNWTALTVKPLDPKEREEMINHYLRRFGKTLEDWRLHRIAAAPQTANPLFLKVVLDELRVTGTFEGLDRRLDEYLKAADIRSLLAMVLARYQGDYDPDRRGLVADTLGLILAARRGLAESELLELLRPQGKPRLPQATWAPFRAALDESLISRGGILTFAHDHFRSAVQAAFAGSPGVLGRLRIRLADYFEPLPPTDRTCDELPWLLDQAESLARLRACLLDIERFLLIRNREGREGTELKSYWVRLGEATTMGQCYVRSFEAWASRNPNEQIEAAATELGFFLYEFALNAAAEPLFCRALALKEARFGKHHPEVAKTLSNLARVLCATGRSSEAEPLLRRAEKIHQATYGKDYPHVAVVLTNLALLLMANNRHAEAEPLMRRAVGVSLAGYGENHPQVAGVANHLAQLLKATGRQAEAERQYRWALAIDEKCCGNEHPNVGRDLNGLATLLKAADRLVEAEPLYRRALAIYESAYGKDHPNVATILNNLARLLYSTNRPDEAVQMMHRVVEILLKFTRAAGHPHPQLQTAIGDYGGLLEAFGKDPQEIRGTIEPLLARYGMHLDIQRAQ